MKNNQNNNKLIKYSKLQYNLHFKFIKPNFHEFINQRILNNEDCDNSREYKIYKEIDVSNIYDENFSIKLKSKDQLDKIFSNNVLIVFLSCKKNSHLWDDLLKLRDNSIIFYGDENIKDDYILKDRILTLKCKDTYDHLPTKIVLMIKSILEIEEFKNITHIFKIDDYDTILPKNLNLQLFYLNDYCGQELIKKLNIVIGILINVQ